MHIDKAYTFKIAEQLCMAVSKVQPVLVDLYRVLVRVYGNDTEHTN